MICVSGNGIVRAVEKLPSGWLPICDWMPSVAIEECLLVRCCSTTRDEACEFVAFEVAEARFEDNDPLEALYVFEARLRDEYDGHAEQFAELARERDADEVAS